MLIRPFQKGDPLHKLKKIKSGDDLIKPASNKPLTKHETDGKDRKKEPKADN